MDTMLTPQDVADILALSYDKALDFIKHSGLEYNLIGRQYRVSEKAINDFINGATTASVKSSNKNIYNNRNADNKIKLRRFA